MAEEIKKQEEAKDGQAAPLAQAPVNNAAPAQTIEGRNSAGFSDRKRNFKGRRGGGRGRDSGMPEEFEQKMIDIARVTRVMAGGKRMRFRACVAIGNKKGRVAIGLAKGADVTGAVTKAVNKAKKDFIDIPIVNETIPHEIYQKLGAAKILFKPAKKGRGIIAGGAVRVLLELSGIKNITCKILGTGNKVNNVKCTIEALKNLKRPVKQENKNNNGQARNLK
ncbi:MAG: 30S ribosomal protein S5 [Patescibacteria group bacterium]|nr:30S ribosomal protein S5 [Patescibacteria group bacterium]